jgi:hypothetical protein
VRAFPRIRATAAWIAQAVGRRCRRPTGKAQAKIRLGLVFLRGPGGPDRRVTHAVFPGFEVTCKTLPEAGSGFAFDAEVVPAEGVLQAPIPAQGLSGVQRTCKRVVAIEFRDAHLPGRSALVANLQCDTAAFDVVEDGGIQVGCILA